MRMRTRYTKTLSCSDFTVFSSWWVRKGTDWWLKELLHNQPNSWRIINIPVGKFVAQKVSVCVHVVSFSFTTFSMQFGPAVRFLVGKLCCKMSKNVQMYACKQVNNGKVITLLQMISVLFDDVLSTYKVMYCKRREDLMIMNRVNLNCSDLFPQSSFIIIEAIRLPAVNTK
jgi:hypothetical protein